MTSQQLVLLCQYGSVFFGEVCLLALLVIYLIKTRTCFFKHIFKLHSTAHNTACHRLAYTIGRVHFAEGPRDAAILQLFQDKEFCVIDS